MDAADQPSSTHSSGEGDERAHDRTRDRGHYGFRIALVSALLAAAATTTALWLAGAFDREIVRVTEVVEVREVVRVPEQAEAPVSVDATTTSVPAEPSSPPAETTTVPPVETTVPVFAPSDLVAVVASQAIPSIVTVQILDEESVRDGSGSGVVISSDGFIVTNHHVIDGADTLKVIMSDGLSYPAELIGSDPGYRRARDLFQQLVLRGGGALLEPADASVATSRALARIVTAALRKYAARDDTYAPLFHSERLPLPLRRFMRSMFATAAPEGEPLGRLWSPDGERTVLRGHPDPAARAAALRELCTRYTHPRARLARIAHRDLDEVRSAYPEFGGLLEYSDISKEQVLATTEAGERLPSGITRFLVPRRVLGFNLPLSFLETNLPLDEKRRRLEDLVADRFETGRVRYYAEPAFVFDD